MESNEAIQLISQRYEAMGEQNHYEFLGVGPDATEMEIKAAYRRLIRQFHSDRFRNLDLGPVAEMLDAVFARINDAHNTLTSQREAYDAELQGGGRVAPDEMVAIFEAEDAFRRAKQLLERGQYKPALEKLQLVIDVNPDDPDSRAYYLFAKFISAPARESGRRSREANKAQQELGEIADEHRDLVAPSLLFAKSLKLLGKEADARKYFKRVLRLEPNNRDAAREMRLMDMRNEKESFFDKLRSIFKR